jgi:6-phosphogluconolactonase/glucosamine-6-phosphate isomerase/deaminase
LTARVEVLPPNEWAATVASRLLERVAAQPAIRLCLPTGDTPTPVYEAVVAGARARGVSFARATVVGLDEWVGLAPGDPARCDTRLRRELIDRLDPPPVYRPIAIDGVAADTAAAAHDAEAARLDLVLLGLGQNGHVGFNEPGSSADSATRVVALAESSRLAAVERYGARRMPEAGITVGMDRLLEAGEIWLLVTGERKRDVLGRALHAPESADSPASFLRRHQRLHVIADEAAASVRAGR